MARRPLSPLASVLAVAVLCFVAIPSQAQKLRPCPEGMTKAEDAAWDATKDAFYMSVDYAGAKIGAVGLGPIGVNEALGASVKTATQWVSGIDSLVLDPINKYLEDPSDGAVQSAFNKLLENVAKMSLESAGRNVLSTSAFAGTGLVIAAGRITVGTSTWAVNEMLDSAARQQKEATLFGRSQELMLGTIGNLPASDPFFTSGPVTNRRWTPENIGTEAKSEEELQRVWNYYGDYLKGGPMMTRGARAEVDQMLKDVWPLLKEYWSMKRAGAFLEASRTQFGRTMALVRQKSVTGHLIECDDAIHEPRRPTVKPMKGAFGPPVTRFGRAPGPQETNDQKVSGTMTKSSMKVTVERKPASEGSVTITHTFSGTIPDILKPGDIIELSCESAAEKSGPNPLYVGGNCQWWVEGNVTMITPPTTKMSFAGYASDGKFYDKSTSTTKFKVETGGRLSIQAWQKGPAWGATDNWVPAEYVYTFVP